MKFSLNFFGTELISVDVRPLGLDLNNGVFHRGIFTVEPDPADAAKALFSVDIIEDINGENPTEHNVISNLPVDIDLGTLPANRVIAGGRTGGAFVDADIDNISVRFVHSRAQLDHATGTRCRRLGDDEPSSTPARSETTSKPFY